MDIVGTGLWQDDQMNFFDVRVVHANSASYLSTSPAALYKEHEQRKKKSYLRRVQMVEGGSFTPLIMSTSGGLGEEFLKVIKKAASKIEDKGEKYPGTLATIKRKLRFSILSPEVNLKESSRLQSAHKVTIPGELRFQPVCVGVGFIYFSAQPTRGPYDDLIHTSQCLVAALHRFTLRSLVGCVIYFTEFCFWAKLKSGCLHCH
eukprot:sb/3470519/